MINLKKYNVILWDFDGVIMDSMPTRDKGFEMVLADYPQEQVRSLMDFHRQNGGLSRYVKFRYFFENIRNEQISDEEVNQLAIKFSEMMKAQLIKRELLIKDTIRFIEKYHARYIMHIVSGSDENELRFLCERLLIDKFFLSIHGSPVPKIKLVPEVMKNNRYSPAEMVLIGDSRNDFEAASASGIDFIGYNNSELAGFGVGYLTDSYSNVLA